MPQFKVNSAGPSHPHLLADVLVLPSVYVNTLGDRNKAISKLYQLSGNAVSPTACMMLCVRFVCFVRNVTCRNMYRYIHYPLLRHRRNTRYGWVASPYPTGTFTLQDAPSFAWRANDKPVRPEQHRGVGPRERSDRTQGAC